MKDICDHLDRVLLDLFPNDGIKFNGLCQMVSKVDQVHPVTIEDNKQVSIDDKWDVIMFHRLNGQGNFIGSDGTDEDQGFGRTTRRAFSQPMRTIIAHKVNKGEEWIYDFLEQWPEEINVKDSAGINIYDFVDFEDLNIDTDQESIYINEWGNNSYEKHRIPWNIYALEYNVEFKRCVL